jgi:hypothetical protein
MRRALAFALLGALAMVAVVGATETRTTTMGDVNHIVKDDFNIWIWPQTLTLYPDRMIGEFIGNDFHTAGGHFAVGMGVLGVYFTDGVDYAPWIWVPYPVWSVGRSPVPDGLLDQRIDLFYAHTLGELQGGLGLFLYGEGWEYDEENDESARSDGAFGVTLGGTMAGFEAGAFLGTVSWEEKDEDGETIVESDGTLALGLLGRYWYAGLALTSWGETAGDTKTESTAFVLGLGVGVNHHATESVMAVADAGMMISGGTDKIENATDFEESWARVSVPYFRLGVEADVFKWMDFRMGAAKFWNAWAIEEDDGDKYAEGWADTDLYVGAGFHFRNLDIDAMIDPGFFQRGPYFVSGSSGNLTQMVSVRYTWGG